MGPVSFSLVEFGGERLIFRLADGQGKLLDLMLNPAVTVAFRDCILAEYLNNGPSRPSAALGEGQVE